MPNTIPPADPPIADGQKTHDNNRFFAWLRGIGIRRQPGWIGGVAAGVADRIGIDVVIVRGILVVVALFGAPALLLYAAAWLLIPDAEGTIHLEQMVRGRFESPLVGIAILVALSVLPVAPSIWSLGSAYWGEPFWGASIGRALWTFLVLGLLIWFVVWFSRSSRRGGDAGTASATPAADADNSAPAASAAPAPTVVPEAPAAPPVLPANASADEVTAWRASQAQWRTEHDLYRRQQAAERQAASQAASAKARDERTARAASDREARRRTRSHPLYSVSLIGGALAIGGIATLTIGGGHPGPTDFLAGTSIAVGVLGLGIIANGAMGRRSGGASAIAVILVLPLLAAGIFPQSATFRYAGSTTFTPHFVSSETTPAYAVGFGDVTIDLRHFWSTAQKSGTHSGGVRLVVGAGNTIVLLPPHEYASIQAHTARGDVRTPDKTVDGTAGVSLFENLPVGSDKDFAHARRFVAIEVFTGQGNITFIKAPATKGATP